MHRFIWVVALGLSFLTVSGAAYSQRALVPIAQFGNQTWANPKGKVFSESQVLEGITKAIQTHKVEQKFPWQLDSLPDGKLGASVKVRDKHTVRVLIGYTSTNFSVTYLSSENMKAGKQTATPPPLDDFGSRARPGTKEIEPGTDIIHPAYNLWAGDLVKAIRAELEKM